VRAIVKLEALKALGAFIESQIPELKGKTEIHQVPPDYKMGFPRLAIVAGGRYRYEPRQEGYVTRTSATAIVVNVGSWETVVQLRLACATPAQRYDLEDRLSALFWRVENRPAVLLTTVTACQQLGDILAAWDIGDTDWNDEMAFSSQFWSVLTLEATIPALVTREGIYSLDELRLGITDEFDTPETSAAFDALATKVLLNEDGTVTPI